MATTSTPTGGPPQTLNGDIVVHRFAGQAVQRSNTQTKSHATTVDLRADVADNVHSSRTGKTTGSRGISMFCPLAGGQDAFAYAHLRVDRVRAGVSQVSAGAVPAGGTVAAVANVAAGECSWPTCFVTTASNLAAVGMTALYDRRVSNASPQAAHVSVFPTTPPMSEADADAVAQCTAAGIFLPCNVAAAAEEQDLDLPDSPDPLADAVVLMLESVLENTVLPANERFEAAVLQYHVAPLCADDVNKAIKGDGRLAVLLLKHTVTFERAGFPAWEDIHDIEGLARRTVQV